MNNPNVNHNDRPVIAVGTDKLDVKEVKERKKTKKVSTKKEENTPNIVNENSKENTKNLENQIKFSETQIFELKEELLKQKNEFDIKIKEMNENFERLLEEKEMLINQKDEEIEEIKQTLQKTIEEADKKEKTIQNISTKNKKLLLSLEDLKKEVDEKLDKVSFKQIVDKTKKKDSSPLEIVLKVKEKELKNSANLIEIIKKENENLSKNLLLADFKRTLEIEDKLKLEERKNSELNTEIRTLQRLLEEHKRCDIFRTNFEKEKGYLKDEVKKMKDLGRDYQVKLQEEENRHSKTREALIKAKQELEAIRRANKQINYKKDSDIINKIYRNIEQEDQVKIKERESSTNNNNTGANNRQNSMTTRALTNLKPRNRFETEEKNKQFKKINYLRIMKDNNEKGRFDNVLTVEELTSLSNKLTQEEVELVQRKIEAIYRSKESIENKLKTEIKLIQKTLTEKEEQYNYLLVQFKEMDHSNKILMHQQNEGKNESKTYQRKITTLYQEKERILLSLKEKEQENKMLINQLNQLRKVTKSNVLAPMDNEVVMRATGRLNETLGNNEAKNVGVSKKDGQGQTSFEVYEGNTEHGHVSRYEASGDMSGVEDGSQQEMEMESGHNEQEDEEADADQDNEEEREMSDGEDGVNDDDDDKDNQNEEEDDNNREDEDDSNIEDAKSVHDNLKPQFNQGIDSHSIVLNSSIA